MSRTDNTVPFRLWAAYGLDYDNSIKRYLGSHKSRTKDWRTFRHRAARRAARMALHRGIEPEPYRPRNSVLWDAL